MKTLPHTLAGSPGARRARKIPVLVRVTFATTSGQCQTLEGSVQYAAGDALVEGEKADRWPVERDVFSKNYAAEAPTVPMQEGLYRRVASEVMVLQLTEPSEVPLSRGRGILEGKSGDWLVEYGPGNFAIVSQAIFAATYELFD
jgi:hypothetical protein